MILRRNPVSFAAIAWDDARGVLWAGTDDSENAFKCMRLTRLPAFRGVPRGIAKPAGESKKHHREIRRIRNGNT